ncbi:hypothetical protein VE01_09242 [Pseudogymnoascus verrucosus]|uniref:YCII-related domain-containing protein n=1 Tax=Pseudogymnoascus verrucosus TaxID=342668 RepID=A0A1B8GBH2_9PEZI|nr:uncharacterized protein VE01_09242 [Pseudogymnoascus verrucosus]OBT93181.1 hypothetical protein VE01_09242 [Pseudogymnoascus verrucosus]
MAQAVRTAVLSTISSPSIAAGKTSEWLVLLADKPGVLERRLQIRPVHSKNFVRLHESGFVSWAGPVFEEHVIEGTRPFIGSIMVVNAPSREIVKETLQKDIFVKEGIWDWDHVRIFPFRTILRQAASKTA